jgi:hypothetical protein
MRRKEMGRINQSLVTLSLVFFLAGLVNAATIDFGPSFGAPASGHVVLTDQLSSWGVTFSTTDPEGVFWWGGDYPWSPGAYSIMAGSPGGLNVSFGVEPIRVDFSTSVTEATIRGFDGGGDTDTLILKAFDGTDSLLDLDSITSVFMDPGLTATVSGANITYITFEVSVTGDHGLFFDDLSFTPIPIPGAVWLFGSGLIGLLGLRKRFKKS